jgi:hypothetical protein
MATPQQRLARQAHCEEVLDLWCKQVEHLVREPFDASAAPPDRGGTGAAVAMMGIGASTAVDVHGPLDEITMWRNRLVRLKHMSDQFSNDDAKQVLHVNTLARTKGWRAWQLLQGRLADRIAVASTCERYLAKMEEALGNLYQPQPKIAKIARSIGPIFSGIIELCMSAKAYQTEAMMHRLLHRIVRQVITAVKHALSCASDSNSEGEGPHVLSQGEGPHVLWRLDTETSLQRVQNARTALTKLKSELEATTTYLEGQLKKQSSKTPIDLKPAGIFQQLDPLIVRLGQLCLVFDAWSRYRNLESMHVPLGGVQLVIENFMELVSLLTHNKTRSDFLDSLSYYSDFYREVVDFHLNLSKLDERLWLLLESAVGSSASKNAEEAGTTRLLSTSEALGLMNKFEAIFSRKCTGGASFEASSARFRAGTADEKESQELEDKQASSREPPPGETLVVTSGAGPWKSVEKLYFLLLRRLLDHVRSMQIDYEHHKDKPPTLRNESPVIQHVVWGQLLRRRVQSVIRDCKSMPVSLHAAPLFRKVLRIATNTDKTLGEFLSRWYSAWLATVEVTKSGLNATLLVHHPVNLKLVVNFDSGISQLIRDAKGFLREGYPLPRAAQQVLERERELKTFRNALEEAIQKFDSCISSIPYILRPLFADMVDDLTAKLIPGHTSLTWLSINIDAFVASVEAGIAHLHQVVEKGKVSFSVVTLITFSVVILKIKNPASPHTLLHAHSYLRDPLKQSILLQKS